MDKLAPASALTSVAALSAYVDLVPSSVRVQSPLSLVHKPTDLLEEEVEEKRKGNKNSRTMANPRE